LGLGKGKSLPREETVGARGKSVIKKTNQGQVHGEKGQTKAE